MLWCIFRGYHYRYCLVPWIELKTFFSLTKLCYWTFVISVTWPMRSVFYRFSMKLSISVCLCFINIYIIYILFSILYVIFRSNINIRTQSRASASRSIFCPGGAHTCARHVTHLVSTLFHVASLCCRSVEIRAEICVYRSTFFVLNNRCLSHI